MALKITGLKLIYANLEIQLRNIKFLQRELTERMGTTMLNFHLFLLTNETAMVGKFVMTRIISYHVVGRHACQLKSSIYPLASLESDTFSVFVHWSIVNCVTIVQIVL